VTIYTIALSKGGSTKTTTAAELIVELARRGRRVLAIDGDEQGNLTTRLGITDDTPLDGVAADVILGALTPKQAAAPAPAVPGADVLAGTHDLANLHQRPEAITSLRDQLPALTDWDDVVIDTPPAMGIITLAALAAADQVIAAVACETEALYQLDRLAEVIQSRVRPVLRPGQNIHWIIPTRHDARRLLDREIIADLAKHWPGRVTNPIREAVAARDAFTAGLPVSIYAADAGIADDYRQALATILKA
jgi:chromosome partitioning protein